MGLRASDYFRAAGAADLGGAYQQGLSIGDMIRKKKMQEGQMERDKQTRDILGQEGALTENRAQTIGQVAKYNPQLAMNMQKQLYDEKRLLENQAYRRSRDEKEDKFRQDTLNLKKVTAAQKAKQKGKLSAKDVLNIQQGAQIPKMLQDVKQTLETQKDIFGPIGGRLASWNPYDETAQTVDSQVRASSQAFGRFMEGGVLRKEDEEKYRKMFPNLTDTPEVAKNKLAVVEKLLADKQKGDIDALTKAGYDTSAFEQVQDVQLPKVLTEKTPGKESYFNPVKSAVASDPNKLQEKVKNKVMKLDNKALESEYLFYKSKEK